MFVDGFPNANHGKQTVYLPDGRILYASDRAKEILPPSGAVPPGAIRVDAGGIAVDLPGTIGRELFTGSAIVGVAELANGHWFSTATNGAGGVFDMGAGGLRLTTNPGTEHRRFIEPFYAHAGCLDLLSPAPGSCPLDPGDGGAGP